MAFRTAHLRESALSKALVMERHKPFDADTVVADAQKFYDFLLKEDAKDGD